MMFFQRIKRYSYIMHLNNCNGKGINVKTLITIIFLVFQSGCLFASEREQIEKKLVETMELRVIAKRSIEIYKAEAVRLYPHITKENVNAHFSDVFTFGEQQILEAYTNSFSLFTDEELKKLVEFYSSDFGKWYQRKFHNFNNTVQSNLAEATKALNNAYIKRVNELQPRPY